MVQTRKRALEEAEASQKGTHGSNDQSDQPAHLVDDAVGEESREEVSKRQIEVTPSRDTVQKRVKRAHGKPKKGSPESSDHPSAPLWSLVHSFERSRDEHTQHHVLWQVLKNAAMVSTIQPLTFLGYPSDTEESEARATTIGLYSIVKLQGDAYLEPVMKIAAILGIASSELESQEAMEPLFKVLFDTRLQQVYENATPLIQDLWENRDIEKTIERLDDQNSIINEQWGFECEIQYATLLQYREEAHRLARDVSTSHDKEEARESLHQQACKINEQARNFLIENRYPARWQTLLSIEGQDLWLSYPVQDESSAYRSKRRFLQSDEETFSEQQDEIRTISCTPGKAQTQTTPGNTRNGIQVIAYSKITYTVKSRVFQKMVFIVQPHPDTEIYEIQSGTAMGHQFMQTFLSSPSTLPCLDKRTSLDISQLQSRYVGVRAVAYSRGSDRVEVEAVFQNNHGQEETIWLNRLRMHKLLGAKRADVEIQKVFKKGNKTPPWIKTQETKGLRPRKAVEGSPGLDEKVLHLREIVTRHEAQIQRICSRINCKFDVPNEDTTTKGGERPTKLKLRLKPRPKPKGSV